MPFADNDKNYPYHEPEEPQTKEQLWAKLVEQNKKLSPDDPDARRKLYNHCCMFGTARDAVDLFEEIQGVPMADSSYLYQHTDENHPTIPTSLMRIAVLTHSGLRTHFILKRKLQNQPSRRLRKREPSQQLLKVIQPKSLNSSKTLRPLRS